MRLALVVLLVVLPFAACVTPRAAEPSPRDTAGPAPAPDASTAAPTDAGAAAREDPSKPASAASALAALRPCSEFPRPSLTVGRLTVAAQRCTMKACPRTVACCNGCSWTAKLISSGNEHALAPEALTRTLGGPPSNARDCDLVEWNDALSHVVVGVVNLPLEENARSAAGGPTAICLQGADR